MLIAGFFLILVHSLLLLQIHSLHRKTKFAADVQKMLYFLILIELNI